MSRAQREAMLDTFETSSMTGHPRGRSSHGNMLDFC
jgi:hypothetical protein